MIRQVQARPFIAGRGNHGRVAVIDSKTWTGIAEPSGSGLKPDRRSWIAQQWRGAKLPSILTVPGCSTTSIDHPSSVGCMQPVEADKYQDQCTRTT